MSQVILESDVKAYLETCGAFLRASPVEHNVILSICAAAREKGSADIRFATVMGEEGVSLTSVQAGKHNLVLSRGDGASAEALAQELAARGHAFPAVVGPSDVAASFSDGWTRMTGRKFVDYMDQIIYALTRVVAQPAPEGSFRLADATEAPLLAQWISAFTRDALPQKEQVGIAQALSKAQEMIEANRIAVWDVGGKPVAQAAFSAAEDTARVSLVYTPPDRRGRGYASAVVSRLSAKLLAEGKAQCCLYADARNPVSNSIYRKIGYEFVGRSSMHILEDAS